MKHTHFQAQEIIVLLKQIRKTKPKGMNNHSFNPYAIAYLFSLEEEGEINSWNMDKGLFKYTFLTKPIIQGL